MMKINEKTLWNAVRCHKFACKAMLHDCEIRFHVHPPFESSRATAIRREIDLKAYNFKTLEKSKKKDEDNGQSWSFYRFFFSNVLSQLHSEKSSGMFFRSTFNIQQAFVLRNVEKVKDKRWKSQKDFSLLRFSSSSESLWSSGHFRP